MKDAPYVQYREPVDFEDEPYSTIDKVLTAAFEMFAAIGLVFTIGCIGFAVARYM